MQTFEDVMFDTEAMDLAESFADLPEAIEAVIISDEEPQEGEEIYFGLPTATGDIAEIKATVRSVEEAGDDEYRITVLAIQADEALLKAAADALSGKFEDTAGEGGPMWALGLKQQNNTYAVLANSPGGVLTAVQLAKISEIAEKGAGLVKLTHAQRVVLLLNADQLDEASEELKSVGLRVGVLHHGIRNVRACCGSLCRFCQGTDAISLSQSIDDRLYGRGTNFDVKIAVSDCMRNCSESYCADIGLIADKGTYSIVIGGRGSQVPFRAIKLAEGIPQDRATDAIEKVVDWYTGNAEPGERLHKMLRRIGSDMPEADLGGLEVAFASVDDGIDEVARMREQLTRLAGVRKMRAELQF